MVFVGRIIRTGSVWSTMLMTLVAGLPYFACRCPDGHVKSFCLGTVSATSGCCCGGICCSSLKPFPCCSHAQSLQTRSCCENRDPQVNSPGKQPKVGPRGCTRTLAASELVLTLPDGKPTLAKDLTPAAGLAAQFISAVCLPTVADDHPCWQSHQVAPPIDLVITLQRFLV